MRLKKQNKYVENRGNVCSVSDCERSARIRGLCRMHYCEKYVAKQGKK